MMKGNRLLYIDILKAFGIFLVILGHVLNDNKHPVSHFIFKEKQDEVKQKFDEMSDCYDKCRKFCDDMKSKGYILTDEEKIKEGLLLERYKASMNEFQNVSEELSNMTAML